MRDVVAILEMWWLIGSALDYWGSGPGFEYGLSHRVKLWGQAESLCTTVHTVKSRGREGYLPLRQKKYTERIRPNYCIVQYSVLHNAKIHWHKNALKMWEVRKWSMMEFSTILNRHLDASQGLLWMAVHAILKWFWRYWAHCRRYKVVSDSNLKSLIKDTSKERRIHCVKII